MTVPLYNLTDTWNNAGTVFTGLQLNVTNTASAAASLLMDLQVGSATKFNVDVGGNITLAQNGGMNIGLFGGTCGFGRNSGIGGVNIYGSSYSAEGAAVVNVNSTAVTVANPIQFNAGNVNTAAGSFLLLDAAAILAQRNGTNAQTLRVYNTFTDASNYERGVFDWTTTANSLTIGTQSAGTGTGRNVKFSSQNFYDFLGIGAGNTDVRLGTQFGSNSISGVTISRDAIFAFTPNGGLATGTADAGIGRTTASVMRFGDGSASNANGWMQWGGQTRVTSDVTFTSTTTLATITGLSVNVAAGRTYSFEAYLSWTDAAAGGIQAAIAGTATATAIEYDGWIIDSGANGIKGNTQSTALGTAVATATTTGTAGVVQIKGTITVNAAGTLLVQAAQNTSNGTATTIKRGSYFLVYDMP